jgi:hypothetical protein
MVYLISVVLFSQIIRTTSGNENSALAIVISTLVIAALFNPMRTYIQRFIDRRFYRSKYDAQRTLELFAETIRDEVGLNQLQSKLVDTVAQSIQPEHVSIWLKEYRET